MGETQTYEELLKIGVAGEDAKVIADCVKTERSCSWVNTEPFDLEKIKELNSFLASISNVFVTIQSIPTRNKLIWDVKIRKK